MSEIRSLIFRWWHRKRLARERFEDAVEQAYWAFHSRRLIKGGAESERDSFKWAVRTAMQEFKP